jgi:hypothetical protein
MTTAGWFEELILITIFTGAGYIIVTYLQGVE